MPLTRSWSKLIMLKRHVEKFLARKISGFPGAELLVAVSGGLDSMVLLHVLAALAKKYPALKCRVVHFNHHLRGQDADDDENFVARYCRRQAFELIVGQGRDLQDQRRQRGFSLEEAAREARYAFFDRCLKKKPTAWLLTAHTASDQAETVIMNLLRGSGLRGLKGIPAQRGRILRPLLALDRHIPAAANDLRNGVWNKKRYSKADGLMGKTFGIIGVGEIGLAVAERARSFGMTVIAERKADRRPDIEARIRSTGIRLVDDLDAILAESDIVSIHVPGGERTVNLVDAGFLAKMKPDSILLNTSRGEIVDEEALLGAIQSKGIRAGLDVFRNEPDSSTGEFASRLAAHPSVVGTHHIGASTQQAQDATSAATIDVIEAYRAGDPTNCVNVVRTRVERRPSRSATSTGWACWRLPWRCSGRPI